MWDCDSGNGRREVARYVCVGHGHSGRVSLGSSVLLASNWGSMPTTHSPEPVDVVLSCPPPPPAAILCLLGAAWMGNGCSLLLNTDPGLPREQLNTLGTQERGCHFS